MTTNYGHLADALRRAAMETFARLIENAARQGDDAAG